MGTIREIPFPNPHLEHKSAWVVLFGHPLSFTECRIPFAEGCSQLTSKMVVVACELRIGYPFPPLTNRNNKNKKANSIK